jgi:hypothetical protein
MTMSGMPGWWATMAKRAMIRKRIEELRVERSHAENQLNSTRRELGVYE